jgi:hypothetical protein
MLTIKFLIIWQSVFSGEDCFEMNQSDTKIAWGGHVCYFLNSSPLKPIGQMNRILVESIYGRSSVQIVHFALIH